MPSARTVIVIEDEPQIRRFVRGALEAEQWQVHEAATLRDGLSAAGTRQPDLLVLDLGLPDGDGVELIREVRAWSNAAIIVLSARTDEADKIAALDAGADVLRDREDRGDVVARVRILRRQERVVVVEFADGDAVGPRRPLRARTGLVRHAEHRAAVAARRHRVRQRLRTGCADGTTGEGCRGHRRVVDDPVHDHVDDVVLDGDRIDGDLRDLVGELLLAGQRLVAAVDADVVGDGHVGSSGVSDRESRIEASALCRCTCVAWAARSPSPAAIAPAVRRCSATEAARRSGLSRARRRTRTR